MACAAVHRLASIRWPYRSIVIAAVACPRTRCTTLGSARAARVAIVDSEGARARACPRHGVTALDGIASAHVDWADSKGLNEWECKDLGLAEERSQLG